MSCHFLPVRPDVAAGRRALTVSCGADRERGGFFLSVRLQRALLGENPVLESLSGDGEADIDQLLARAAQWAVVPAGLKPVLLQDAARLR